MKPRILFLADINSPHTQKWALSLAENNFEIGIFSFNHSDLKWIGNNKNICCLSQAKKKQSNTAGSKLLYLFLLLKLFIIIIRFRPRAIHAHYASSYGLLGALTFYKPLIVSIWGSDLLKFPKKSWLHKCALKFVLWRADKICVSSTLLKKEVNKYSKKPGVIIPFGVNLNAFYQNRNSCIDRPFTFGCLKQFEENYNIENVVDAFHLLTNKYPEKKLGLKLMGDGTLKNKIHTQITRLGLVKQVELTGWVDHCEVPQHLNTIDVLINVSEYESFGVSIAEAMACKIPVIISKAEGFKDLVPDNHSAFITASNYPHDIFIEMESCLFNIHYRNVAVNKSYSLVRKKFDWVNNLKQMELVYLDLMAM